MPNLHSAINNENRFLRDPNSPRKWHENVDNIARVPAQTICGRTIAQPMYDDAVRSIGSNSPIDQCIYCHEGIKDPSA